VAPSEGERDQGFEVELERTLGLPEALAIGIGTMVGAGIFVFPGLAAGRAGLAATASFAIGAVIALLVALPASELATAMPRSGGGYFFVSRGFGPLAGCVIGIGLWLGLVFASSFYLVGFGYYLLEVLAEFGLTVRGLVKPLGVATAVLLTAISVTGTEKAGKLQNNVVGILLVILVVFLLYGVLDSLGIFGGQHVPEEIAPFGAAPVFTTAALVFTSYLGFAQIATVAGDIEDPGRNLPLAMVGSVLVVSVLYVATIFVATGAFGSAKLGEFGETALVEVARSYVGVAGAVAITFAGLLATVSSANASILSSSRAIYALSRDGLLPREISRVNARYSTPHLALISVGAPVVVLVWTGRVEVLAEVASFLHLVMYGLICFALIALRRSNPDWYDPGASKSGSYQSGLERRRAISVPPPRDGRNDRRGHLVLCVRERKVYGEGRGGRGVRPEYVPKVLVPVEVSAGDEPQLSPLLASFLSPLKIVLLGYYRVPEQTALSQAETDFGDEANERMRALTDSFDVAGAEVTEAKLVFTHDEAQTLERVANEEECDAVLIPNESDGMDRVLVPLRGSTNVKMILYFVNALLGESASEVTLVNVASSEDAVEEKRLMLKGAEETLDEMGIDPSRIDSEVHVAKDVVAKLIEVSEDYDIMVIGESEPTISTLVLGEVPERVERRADCPILVVKGAAEE